MLGPARPGPPGRASPDFLNSARARPGPARPAFGPARLTSLLYSVYNNKWAPVKGRVFGEVNADMRQAIGPEKVSVVSITRCRCRSKCAHFVAENKRTGPLVALFRYLLQVDPLYSKKNCRWAPNCNAGKILKHLLYRLVQFQSIR